MPLAARREADGAVAPGAAYVADTPLLRGHAGTQPDLWLGWNRVPAGAATVDAAVHLHGFSQQRGAMPLAEKVERSGLDPSCRARPTLALLPRGNWRGHTHYDFPALLAGGLDRLVAHGLDRFAAAIGAPEGLARDRLVLTAHSGGVMAAVDALAGALHPPDELHLFDGLYGRDPAQGDPLGGLDILEDWLAQRLAAEPRREGALRVVYIEAETGPFSRALGDAIDRHLAAADPALREPLARRYRVEPAYVQHSQVARRCGPDLLAAADAEFDWWGGR
jgi:hypothetical protein